MSYLFYSFEAISHKVLKRGQLAQRPKCVLFEQYLKYMQNMHIIYLLKYKQCLTNTKYITKVQAVPRFDYQNMSEQPALS